MQMHGFEYPFLLYKYDYIVVQSQSMCADSDICWSFDVPAVIFYQFFGNMFYR